MSTNTKTARRTKGKSVAAASPEPPAMRYQPTDGERASMNAMIARKKQRRPAPRLTIESKKGSKSIGNDHEDERLGMSLLMAAIGSTDASFLRGFLNQAINAGVEGQGDDPAGANYILAVVKGVEPRDEIESMLATQMAAVHMASITMARRLTQADNIPQQDSASNAFNKLARTFAAQVEALRRYRSGGEQRVRVEHVTVNDGGQAIVGNVSHGGRGADQNRQTTP